MAIKELDPGERHSFPVSALRVQLTGTTAAAALTAVDQAGQESVTIRLKPTEIILTPQPRRLRLVASPTGGGTFPGGTTLGLTMATEGASVTSEQVLVTPSDVGALEVYEIGVLEFAEDCTIISVGEVSRTAPVVSPPEQSTFVSADVLAPEPAVAAPRVADSEELTWLRPGRYALRDADRTWGLDDPVAAWGVVLDGSASMLPLHRSGALDVLLGLVCGTYASWTSRWASSCVVAGVGRIEVPAAAMDPTRLSEAAFDRTEPSSWSMLADTVAAVGDQIGAAGAVVIVTDGVPGDVDRLLALSRESPQTQLTVVTTGVSLLGLPSDQPGTAWWQDGLIGLHALAERPNVRVAVVRLDGNGRPRLDESRAAELAFRIAGPASSRVTT